MNLIEGFTRQGFYITSDPTTQPGGFGIRQLFAYGKNIDSYCNGMHNATDFAKYHNAPIESPVNATVLNGTGWNTFGWTLVLGFIDHNSIKRQLIFGHLNRNPLLDFKVGQNVKKGQVVAYQGTSNNLNVTMASHLHMQVQNYEALNEWNFTCIGLNPYGINITTSKPTNNVNPTPTTPIKTVSRVNKNKNRGRSLKAHFSGRIDSLGAEVRKRKGNRLTGFNWNTKAGYDLKHGDLVYIFEVHNGWGRIYTGELTGKGSNDWIWLGRLQV